MTRFFEGVCIHRHLPFEHGERGVLRGGEPHRADDLVDPRPDGELNLLDHVKEQGRRSIGTRHVPRLSEARTALARTE